MTVTLRTGNDAITWISSQKFINEWKSVLNDCKWSTACQHPDFIIPWYQIYAERCTPVVITEQSDDFVVGILPLALIHGGKRLVGAGMVEAEYQCWVERPENGDQFIIKAIAAIRTAFPSATLHLRYINFETPMDWLKSPKANYFYRLQRYPRPLIKLSFSEIDARLNSKNNRVKINRLKRAGELSFEKIKDHQAFLDSFDEICEKYDSRQKEVYSVSPFQDDQLKKKFYIELDRRGMLHTTVLHVGEQMAAFHAGLFSRDWLHLGINGQSNYFGKQSAGKIHLLMLGAFLHKENFSTLDLTPGGDDYKELFATQHDTVFELFLFPGFFSFLINQTTSSSKNLTKSVLKSLNIRPAVVRRLFGRFNRTPVSSG